MAISRRGFLKGSLATGAGLIVTNRFGMPVAFAQQGTPLPGSSIPQFIDPLPLLSLAGGPMETVTAATATVSMEEFRASVLPSGFVPATGTYTGTWVWGYRTGEKSTDPAGTYIGPVVVASRETPTTIRWVNNLPTGNNGRLTAYWDATDQTMHWADPLHDGVNVCAESTETGMPPTGGCAAHYDGPVPAVPHLHGGEVPPVMDGGPDSWFTSDGNHHGHAYYAGPGGGGATAVYRYPNSQEAAPTWFHDHALGLTRLGVYAGLAGAYPIIDPALNLPDGLHPVGLQQGSSGPVDYLIPMVVQDRQFDTNGQLYFANVGINPEHPFWMPELVGDVNVVNGKAWPFLNVEPQRYRFLFINGSNARAYEMFFTNPITKADGPAIWQIATDGGYLDTPVKIDPTAPKGQLQRLLLQPGERADVIIDFAGFAGQTLLLRNIGRHPFPKGAPPNGTAEGRVLQVRVGPSSSFVPDASYDPASGIPLRPSMIRLAAPAAGALAPGVTADKTRQLTLNEVLGPGGPLELLVNNTEWHGQGQRRTDPKRLHESHHQRGDRVLLRAARTRADTEVWEIVNLTADAHPIHTHLTQFQLINRQSYKSTSTPLPTTPLSPAAPTSRHIGPPLRLPTPGQPAVDAKSAATRTSRRTCRGRHGRPSPTRRAGRTR